MKFRKILKISPPPPHKYKKNPPLLTNTKKFHIKKSPLKKTQKNSPPSPAQNNLIPLKKTIILSPLTIHSTSLFDYGAPATCVASPHVQRIWEGLQTHFITRALSIACFIHNDRKRQHAYLPPIHDRNLYLAKRWYRRAMLHNSGVQDYVDNHTHNERTHTGSRNTPFELIRN